MRERHAAEQPRRAPPQLVARIGVAPRRSSLRVRPQTSPRSSSSGLGLVTSETTISTTPPTMKAMIACQKLALSAEPKWKMVW